MEYFACDRFIATGGFISGAIKLVEGISYIDHVEALSRDGTKWIGAHAGIGVQALPLDYAKNVVWERKYRRLVTAEQYELRMAFLESKIGTKYDYAACFGIGIHDRRIHDSQRFMCSALQYEANSAAGISILNVLNEFAHLITPETFHLSPLWIGRSYK